MPQKSFALPGGKVARAAALLGRNKHALHRRMLRLGIAGARSRHKR
jgi:transcriptional regulator of acetoin/glycerol metabolism